MKLLFWNCRGLGNPRAVRGLLRCQGAEGADVLFLSETKLDERGMMVFKKKLSLAHSEVVDCEGKGGGLAVLWRSGVNMVLKSKSKNHIDMEVQETGGDKWRCTVVYGEPEMKNKTWELMEELKEQDGDHLPWLCAGDFNEILYHYEKEGGIPRTQACLDRFKEVLETCELDDLGFSGDVFTWRNKHNKGSTYIRERLDRAVANVSWRMKFPLVNVKNGDTYHSDHRPVVVDTEMIHKCRGGGGGFKFEASWVKEAGCREVIEGAWGQRGDAGGDLGERLRGVASSLKDWSENVLGDLEKRLRGAKKELEKWRRAPISDLSVQREAL